MRRKDRLLIFTIVGTFVLLFLGLAVLTAILMSRWPVGFVTLWVFFGVAGMLWSLNRQITIARLLGRPELPQEGVSCEYVGCYTSHWEVPHILVFTGYKMFGMLPKFETWLPVAPSELPGTILRDNSAKYLIRFKGVVSETGRFGHMGGNQRKVQVGELLESTTWPNERLVFLSRNPR